jgi:hypothetical protein
MPWWQDTYKYAKLVMSLVAKTDRHETEIKELRDEMRKLSATVQNLVYEMQRDRDKAEYKQQLADKDHELLLSRLQTKLLSYERGLPSPASSEDVL